MKILIRGAGDLATGIAVRLYRAGHQIVMTETAVPLTVRRTVAFSRAVYEKRAEVEGITGGLASSAEEMREILNQGQIAVLVDEKAEIRKEFQPDVLVDAILAKRNLGTGMTDAPFVIGVGPGFTAGEDCHCVVETKRGHMLGRVIWEGTAIPNTGVPGNVGGYTTERLLRAPADGRMEPVRGIGDRVRPGDIVAYTGGVPVRAAMPGMIRGMLQPGVSVTRGLKIGDIDARCEPEYCLTVSDKARAVGGGVLEAVSLYGHLRRRYGAVLLAAGDSSRFGGNKLLTPVKGKPLYRHALDIFRCFPWVCRAVVTGNEEIARAAAEAGMEPVENQNPEKGISHSLKLGMEALRKREKGLDGILFSVCDQPGLHGALIQQIWNLAGVRPGKVICAAHQGIWGNPVYWPQKYFSSLASLSGDKGGKSLMRQWPEEVLTVETDGEALKDIDYQADLEE